MMTRLMLACFAVMALSVVLTGCANEEPETLPPGEEPPILHQENPGFGTPD